MKIAAIATAGLLLSGFPSLANLPFTSIAPILAQGSAASDSNNAGLEFEGFATPNAGTITDTIFHGECPGEKQGNVKARFYSTQTPPGSGRRVVIRNVSRGLVGDAVPFTDRDYSKGRTSESMSVEFGTKHKLTQFVVLEGTNSFEYEIKQGANVIEQGSFMAQLSHNEKERTRNATCSEEKYCRDSENTPLDKCDNVGTRSRCYCPDTPDQTFIKHSGGRY